MMDTDTVVEADPSDPPLAAALDLFINGGTAADLPDEFKLWTEALARIKLQDSQRTIVGPFCGPIWTWHVCFGYRQWLSHTSMVTESHTHTHTGHTPTDIVACKVLTGSD